MRAVLAFALALALALAGCAKDEPAAQTNAILPGTLAGVVTDAALIPIANVNVTVEGANVSMMSDAAGAFSFELLPGEYVVLASHGDYKTGALRASVLTEQVSTLAFQIELVPRVTPRVELAEAEGYLACEALVLAGEDRHVVPCGASDPNARPSVEFPVFTAEGLDSIVLELAWEPNTQAAQALRLEASVDTGDGVVSLGSTEGPSPLKLPVPGRLVGAGTVIVTATPSGGFTDEEAGLDGGVVLQQAFTSYASFFYYAPPPGGYSAIATTDA